MRLPTIYDSFVEKPSDTLSLKGHVASSNERTVKTASSLRKAGYLTDLLDFMGIDKTAFFNSPSNLIHKSSKDFWSVEVDEAGNPVISRCANLEEVQA
jgi:hypothetical protein